MKLHEQTGGSLLEVIRLKVNNSFMAQTDCGKKKVYVHTYKKDDGTTVPNHYRSTPKTSDGQKPSKKR